MKWITLLALFGLATTASAQTGPSHPWDHCTTLQGFGGAAVAEPNTIGTFGAGIGWQLSQRAELEGTAAWLAPRHGTEGFAADLKLIVDLMRPGGFVPYVGGGAGLYHATVNTTDANLAPFYQDRLDLSSLSSRAAYTDPSAVIATGAQFYVARHFSIRPDVTLRFVRDNGRTYRVTTASVGLVYHVEDHVASAHRR
jgi:hypothetical protein